MRARATNTLVLALRDKTVPLRCSGTNRFSKSKGLSVRLGSVCCPCARARAQPYMRLRPMSSPRRRDINLPALGAPALEPAL